jgi:hypothetical protein
MYFKKTRIAAGVSFNGLLLKSRKWRRQEKSELSKFFWKDEGQQKKENTAGCGKRGRTRPCIFFSAGLRLTYKKLRKLGCGG